MAKNSRFHAAGLLLAFGLAVSSQAADSPPASQPAAGAPAIAWTASYDDAVKLAKEQKKPLLIDFRADWCGPCKLLDERVFVDPRVVGAVADWVCVRVDVDADPDVAFAYQIRSIPRAVLVNVVGELVGDHVGYAPPDEFLQFLDDAKPYLDKAVGGQPMPNVSAQLSPEAPPFETGALFHAAAGELVDKLSDPDPAVRDAVVRVLVARKDETRPLVEAALSHPYLGARIAALKALRQMGVDDLDFDPWAPSAERQRLLDGWKSRSPASAPAAEAAPPSPSQ